MPLRILLVLAVVGVSLPPASAAGAQHDRLGPLPGRTRNPLYLLHLQPVLKRPAVLRPGEAAISLEFDHANISDRWSEGTPDGREVIDLDLEMLRTTITARVGLPFGVELGVELPLLSLTGGVLDPGMQRWHEATGLSNGGRDQVQDGRFGYHVARPGWSLRQREPTPLGLGDITVDAQVRILEGRLDARHPGLAARLLVKLPTGRLDRGTGSGVPDLGLVLLGEWGWRFFTWTGQLGFVALGRPAELAPILRTAALTWAISLELNVAAPFSIVAQFHGHTAFHRGVVQAALARSPMGFEVGMRLRLGPIDLCVALGQDPLALDPSEDLALMASIAGRIPPRKSRRDRRSESADDQVVEPGL